MNISVLLCFHQLVKNHELGFKDLTFADSGMYQCIAENRHGTIYANAELKVFGKLGSHRLFTLKIL